jgi:hypothetical protein
MLNIFFKSYCVFFKRKIERGVAAAVFALSIPLGLNIALLLLLIISYFMDVKEFGGPLFGLFIAIIVFVTGMFLRHRYISEARYKSLLPIKYPFVYYLIGIAHYILSVIFFIAGVIILLDTSNVG